MASNENKYNPEGGKKARAPTNGKSATYMQECHL